MFVVLVLARIFTSSPCSKHKSDTNLCVHLFQLWPLAPVDKLRRSIIALELGNQKSFDSQLAGNIPPVLFAISWQDLQRSFVFVHWPQH